MCEFPKCCHWSNPLNPICGKRHAKNVQRLVQRQFGRADWNYTYRDAICRQY